MRADEEEEQPDAEVEDALAALQRQKFEVELDQLVRGADWRRLVLDLDDENQEPEDDGVERADEVHEAAADKDGGGADYAAHDEEGTREEREEFEQHELACGRRAPMR